MHIWANAAVFHLDVCFLVLFVLCTESIVITDRKILCIKYLDAVYHIAQNGGAGKHWRVWQNKHNSPIFYPAKLQIQ